jgi:2-(1,2-epoxy-1,2-dihydrophenyl)acetyl-CoA isomerase
MNSSLAPGLEEHLELESDTMEQAGSSADGKEGVAAFVAKRPPEFTGE